MRKTAAILVLGALVAQTVLAVDLSPASWPEGDLEFYSELQRRAGHPKELAEGFDGMVVGTTGPLAVRAGLEALRQGGSAADAAIVTALSQVTLAAGSWVSYGGVFTMLYYDAGRRRVSYLNGEFTTVLGEDDPLSIPASGPSGRTALVPGFMAGVEAAHRRYGRLPWASLFEPAIYFAEEGFELDAELAATMDFRRGVLARLPETRAIFFKPDGSLYAAGDLFKQPVLAGTLRQVALEGADYMYTGTWAERLVAALAAEGGKMTLEDLAAYRALWRRPRRIGYRGYKIFSPGRPGAGGVLAVRAFRRIKPLDFAATGHYAESADALYGLMAATRSVYELVPPLGAHSDAVITVDADGNVAAVLHSINTLAWGETGIFVDGVSIPDAAASQQGRILAAGPGNRIWSGTNPMIVTRRRDAVLASSAIGNGLFGATVQSLVNVLDFGMDPKEALDTPIFRSPQRSDDPVSEWPMRVTRGQFDRDLLDEVRARGIPIRELSPRDFAGVGYWAGVTLDRDTGALAGATVDILNGWAEGY